MTRVLLVMAALAMTLSAGLEARDSHGYAMELARLLERQNLRAFAAEDSSRPGRFVAVMHFPGVQMLVVAGDYPAPELLRQRLAAGQYTEAYTDLTTAGARDGRFFVEDYGLAGLSAARGPDGRFDITWRDATSSIKYDGDWRAQKLSQPQYQERFARDHTEYERLLQVLTKALLDTAK